MKEYSNMSLEEKLERIEKIIAEYIPPTKWEEANGKMLKYYKQQRKSLEQAIQKKAEKNKYVREDS